MSRSANHKSLSSVAILTSEATTMHKLCILIIFLLAAIADCIAQEMPDLAAAPAAIQKLMPAHAISVLFDEFPIGPNGSKVLVHVYGALAMKSKSSGSADTPLDHPLNRQDLMSSVPLPNCRFTVDFLVQQGGTFERLNRAEFNSVDPVNHIIVKWLNTKERVGPILAVHAGATHWLGWQLIIFPDGVNKPATLQYFGYGGERDAGNMISLDQLDANGWMTVRDNWFEGDKKGERVFPWDGVEFADRKRPYFVILASCKTRTEADTFCELHLCDEGALEIRPSSHYSKLKTGFYIVIANRFETISNAEGYARDLRKHGTVCYVRRAF